MRKNPYLAAALSVLPGAGHYYLGRVKKALALGCIDAAIVIGWAGAPRPVFRALVFGIYLVTSVPAAAECWRLARSAGAAGLESRAYVVFMLLTNGFGALPLLWQSPRFSRRAKIAWTAAVPVLAALFFTALVIMAKKGIL